MSKDMMEHSPILVPGIDPFSGFINFGKRSNIPIRKASHPQNIGKQLDQLEEMDSDIESIQIANQKVRESDMMTE
jgi:hypothetical protein